MLNKIHTSSRLRYNEQFVIVGEPLGQKTNINSITGSGATEGLKGDSYVKQPAGSESGLCLWA